MHSFTNIAAEKENAKTEKLITCAAKADKTTTATATSTKNPQ